MITETNISQLEFETYQLSFRLSMILTSVLIVCCMRQWMWQVKCTINTAFQMNPHSWTYQQQHLYLFIHIKPTQTVCSLPEGMVFSIIDPRWLANVLSIIDRMTSFIGRWCFPHKSSWQQWNRCDVPFYTYLLMLNIY